MKGVSFVVDGLAYIVHVVVHCSHSIEPFCYMCQGEFEVVIKLNGAGITDIETSILVELVGSGGYGTAVKFCERWLCSPAVLPIMVVDVEVLLYCLDCLFYHSICL